MSKFVQNDDFDRKPSLIQRISFYFTGLQEQFREWNHRRLEVSAIRKKKRVEAREERIRVRRTWKQFVMDNVFMLLDYDSTDVESGETYRPTVFRAICQWFQRVIWTRRIELGGTLLLIIIGLLCYFMITSAS